MSDQAKTRVVVASDHAALGARRTVVATLGEHDVEVVDLGPNDDSSVDYPDFARAVAERVAAGEADYGILLCGTGIGMSIAANKVPGIRAALVHDSFTAEMARRHNDANVLVLGGGVLGDRLIASIVDTWVGAPFEGGRHQRRLDKIAELETTPRG